MRTFTLGAMISIAGTAAERAAGDIVSLVAERDATIYENDSGELGNGAGQHLFCGRTNNGFARRSLLSFDLSSMVGRTVTNVTLTLHFSQGQSFDTAASLHRALASWSEGPSDPEGNEGGGAPALEGDVTWSYRSFATDPWSALGGDFDATASADTIIGGSFGFYSFSGAGLVADVQAWIDGVHANHGWFLLGDESAAGTTKRFDASENPNAALRPTLTVEYAVPAPSAGAMLAIPWRRGRRRIDSSSSREPCASHQRRV